MTDEKSGTTGTAARPDSWRRLALLLACVLVLAVVGLAVLWFDRDDDSDTSSGSSADASSLQQAGSDADQAARAAIVQMTSYDYRTVDEDFAWVDDAGTVNFQKQFTASSAAAKKVVTGLKATAQGKVIDSATRVEDADHVTVLLFVDQDIKAAEQQGTKIDQTRVTMTMVRQDGAWLVDNVDLNNLVAD